MKFEWSRFVRLVLFDFQMFLPGASFVMRKELLLFFSELDLPFHHEEPGLILRSKSFI